MIFYHYEIEKRATAPDSAASIATLVLGDLNPPSSAADSVSLYNLSRLVYESQSMYDKIPKRLDERNSISCEKGSRRKRASAIESMNAAGVFSSDATWSFQGAGGWELHVGMHCIG